jgi:hypothetical protein
VAHTVAGRVRRATVLAVFPTSLYLRLGRHEDVLAVLTRHAVDLPIGVRLAVSADELDRGGGWRARPGDHAVVGAGRIALADVAVVVARTRAAAVHRLPIELAAPSAPLPIENTLPAIENTLPAIENTLPAFESTFPAIESTFPAFESTFPAFESTFPAFENTPWDNDLLAASRDVALQALLVREATPAAARLVGAGRGLTPSGDDALCGILLTLRALGHMDAHAAVVTPVRARLGTTTSISAALLAAAVDGWAAPPVVRVLVRLARDPRRNPLDPEDLDVRAVLAIGHTSGADLLTGVVATLDAVTATEALHPHDRQGAPRG